MKKYLKRFNILINYSKKQFLSYYFCQSIFLMSAELCKISEKQVISITATLCVKLFPYDTLNG